jgi:hypothetical protein
MDPILLALELTLNVTKRVPPLFSQYAMRETTPRVLLDLPNDQAQQRWGPLKL